MSFLLRAGKVAFAFVGRTGVLRAASIMDPKPTFSVNEMFGLRAIAGVW
jgi:hypothetical protein